MSVPRPYRSTTSTQIIHTNPHGNTNLCRVILEDDTRKRQSKCECVSKLTPEQEVRLRRTLDVRDHPVFDFLRGGDSGHAWHWQRYIYEPLLPPEGNNYRRLYAAVRDRSRAAYAHG
jgi:hypothetical protein